MSKFRGRCRGICSWKSHRRAYDHGAWNSPWHLPMEVARFTLAPVNASLSEKRMCGLRDKLGGEMMEIVNCAHANVPFMFAVGSKRGDLSVLFLVSWRHEKLLERCKATTN